MQNAAKDFLSQIHPSRDRVGLVTFSDEAALEQQLTDDHQAIIERIDAIETGGGTNLADGLSVALEELKSERHNPDAQPVIILLTDGWVEGSGAEHALVEAEHAKDYGTRIITIGLGDEINAALLEALASAPEDYYYTPTSDTLREIYLAISQVLMCQ